MAAAVDFDFATIKPEMVSALHRPDIIDAELAKRSLYHFVRQAWHVVEPHTTFVDNWHIGAICEHLEAMTLGEIRNLLINIPPRCMKSLIVSVMWPVWSWINNPGTRWLFSSYSAGLSTRDALKSRRIMQSPWFASMLPLWNVDITLTGDQNAKTRYDNTEGGYRISTTINGAATGEGGDFVGCDDAHNVVDAESDVIRNATLLWWDEAMSSRLNDPNKGGRFIIGQRTHQYDLPGHIIEKGGYVCLILPMEFDVSRKCSTHIGFADPRTKQDELLWPDRNGPDVVSSLKRDLGGYGYASQYQQAPGPRAGNMFQVDMLNFIDEIDETNVGREFRSWDKAGTEGAGAWTVGARLGRYKKPRQHEPNCGHDNCQGSKYFVRDVVRGQWSSGKRENHITNVADRDGRKVRILIEQEPGSGGKESAEGTVNRLRGRKVKTIRPTGDKADRADDYSVAVENGEVDVLNASWTDVWVDEHRYFPQSKFKDQVDAGSQGFNELGKKIGVLVG